MMIICPMDEIPNVLKENELNNEPKVIAIIPCINEHNAKRKNTIAKGIVNFLTEGTSPKSSACRGIFFFS